MYCENQSKHLTSVLNSSVIVTSAVIGGEIKPTTRVVEKIGNRKCYNITILRFFNKI